MCQAAAVLRRAELSADAPRASTGGPVRPAFAVERRPPRRSDARNRLVVLGTAGGSNPKATRSGYSNAVVVGDHAYLVDCGEGVHSQSWRARLSMHGQRVPEGGSAIDAIFLTHLHSDHVIDYPNLLLGLWPDHQINVFGPGPAGLPITCYPPDRPSEIVFPEEPTPGVRAMTHHLFAALAYNINVRMADEGRQNPLERVAVHEIGVIRDGYRPDIDLGAAAAGASGASPESAAPAMDPVEIMPTDSNGVRVTAVLVQHAPVFPALAFRFDTPTGSVVFSGDTGPCDNVVRLARGADILVHEAIDVDFVAARIRHLPNRDAIIAHLASSHTAPGAAADIAERAGVRTLVLSHLVPGDNEITEAEWEARARPHFSGQLVCGVDLDEFPIG